MIDTVLYVTGAVAWVGVLGAVAVLVKRACISTRYAFRIIRCHPWRSRKFTAWEKFAQTIAFIWEDMRAQRRGAYRVPRSR